VLSEQLKFEIPQSPELDPVRSQIQRINAAVRSVVQDIDDMIWAAKPENGRLDVLLPRLRQKASEVLDQAGIRCEVHFPIPLPTHPVEARFCSNLLLFTKEAVHNIIKHSEATLAQMRLTLENQQLILSIQDNGRGLPSPPESQSGSGLKNMRDRASEMNGEFSITPVSIAGSGTEVRLRVPLPGMTQSGRESGT
jgi:signal transduction histidine kinase